MNDLTHFRRETSSPIVRQQAAVNAESEAFIAVIGSRPVETRRNHAQILSELRQIAQVAGDAFFYEYPVKDHRTNKVSTISGPTIKLANALLMVYGNCGVDTRVTMTDDHWVFAATFVDAEKGTAMRRLYQQRRNQTSIKGDRDRQEDIAFQIGQSKAIRNVVVNALSLYCDYALDCAREGLVEKVRKNPGWAKERIKQRLSEYNIDVERVVKWVGRGEENWTPEDLAKIIAALQAISERMATVEDIWPSTNGGPPPAPQAPEQSEGSKAQQPPARKGPPPVPTAAPKEEAAAEADGPIHDPDAYLTHLSEQMEEAATQEEFEDIWSTHKELAPRLSEEYQKKARELWLHHQKRLMG